MEEPVEVDEDHRVPFVVKVAERCRFFLCCPDRFSIEVDEVMVIVGQDAPRRIVHRDYRWGPRELGFMRGVRTTTAPSSRFFVSMSVADAR